jgi:hypothetical protein
MQCHERIGYAYNFLQPTFSSAGQEVVTQGVRLFGNSSHMRDHSVAVQPVASSGGEF